MAHYTLTVPVKYDDNGTEKTTYRRVGAVFENQNYGTVLPENSAYREEVNAALLGLRENGIYDELYARCFGADN